MGKSRTSSDEQRMIGTVSNKIKAMSEKERMRRRRIRLMQLTDTEKKLMAKYGKSYEKEYKDTF
tara:strand:+ start:199 stop:390 length:192 start_codon:yes stop_codon:yes gene_type:complete